MADIALEQLLHTAGDNTLSQTDGALHGYMRGTDGTATRTIKTDANGNITISPDSGLGTEATLAALEVLLTSLDGKVATDAKLEAARALLASLDGKVATEAKLEAVRTLVALAQTNTSDIFQAVKLRDWGKEATLANAKNVLDAISAAVAARATEATLESANQALASLDGKVATDAKLEAARLLLASLNGKDFATQTTLAAVLAKLADPATATKQDAAKGVLDAISAAVAARATEATLAAVKTALTDGSQKVQLSGSKVRIASAPATGVKTVTGTAAEVFAGTSRKPGRSRLEIANRHPALAIRVGPAGVTDTTGRSVGPLATLALDMDPMSDVPIYAVSEAGALTVEVFEA